MNLFFRASDSDFPWTKYSRKILTELERKFLKSEDIYIVTSPVQELIFVQT